MKLQYIVNNAIYTYPILYRSKTFQESRLKVLDQIFFTIGNGYEWTKDSVLKYNGKSRKTLPKGFFDKNLFILDVEYDKSNEMKSALNGRFFYSKKNQRFQYNTFIFEAKDEKDAEFFLKFSEEKYKFVHPACNYHPNRPYPISEYSAISEILAGKTNNSFEENFDINPPQDWIDGCIDAVEDAINYYNDEERYKDNPYSKEQTIKRENYDRKTLHKIECNQVKRSNGTVAGMRFNCSCEWYSVVFDPQDGFREYEAKKEMKQHRKQNPEFESIEQYAERNWNEFKNQQLEVFNNFLIKFKK